MVQSMQDFAKEHQCDDQRPPFPFFDTFRDVTGMSEEEARDYFKIFSVPTDNIWYAGIARVVWPAD